MTTKHSWPATKLDQSSIDCDALNGTYKCTNLTLETATIQRLETTKAVRDRGQNFTSLSQACIEMAPSQLEPP